MKTTSREAVSEFVAQRTLALVGASRSGRKFGNVLARELRAKGYTVFVVHPDAETIGGEKCYRSLRDLPEPVGGLVSAVNRASTDKVVEEALEAGIDRVWLQQGTDTPRAVELCRDKGIAVVSGECLLMFAEPVGGVHRFHRGLWRLLGKLPH
jgi:predicted CoA-binding protein